MMSPPVASRPMREQTGLVVSFADAGRPESGEQHNASSIFAPQAIELPVRPAFSDAGERKKFEKEVAAIKLYNTLLEEMGANRFVAAFPVSDLSNDPAGDIVGRIVQRGGRGGQATNSMRLFVRDLRTFMNSRPSGANKSMFPIRAADWELCRNFYKASRMPTAWLRVEDAAYHLGQLGLERSHDIELDAAMLQSVKSRAPSAKPPKLPVGPSCLVLLLDYLDENWGTDDGPWQGDFDDLNTDWNMKYLYGMISYVRFLLAARFDDFDKGFLSADETGRVVRLSGIAHEDGANKNGYVGVEQSVSLVDIRDGSRPCWAQAFLDFIGSIGATGSQFIYPEFVGSPDQFADPKVKWVKMDPAARSGTLMHYCGKLDRSKQADAGVLAFAAGLSPDDMKARGVSGTHIYRRATGEVAAALVFSDRAARVVGEWAPQGFTRMGARSARGSKPSMPKVYSKPYSRELQLEARRVLHLGISSCILAFGAEELREQLDLTWENIIPGSASYIMPDPDTYDCLLDSLKDTLRFDGGPYRKELEAAGPSDLAAPSAEQPAGASRKRKGAADPLAPL